MRSEAKRDDQVQRPSLLSAHILRRARDLRSKQTDAERLLWAVLRNRHFGGHKFRRQHPVPPFVLYFYCRELKLGIELDRGQHYTASGRRADAERSAKLAEHGIAVLRFSDRDVLRDTKAVLERLWEACEVHTPSP